MDTYAVKRLAEVLAIQAEIEGMKAENIDREARGFSQAYGEDSFIQSAAELRAAAAKHDDQL